MRDLKARLRDIVRQDVSAAPARDLTYVPDAPQAATTDFDVIARALGGTWHARAGSGCVRIDREWPGDEWYGRRRLESYAIDQDAPIALFDPRLSGRDDWASRIVFFDIETTGLSGGAGTLAFLVGCGWFESGMFRVRQFFLTGPAGEHALLDALRGVFADASLLITFNGRTFDVPLMETRWAFHRRDAPTGDMPHFDMLPPARRLWSRRASDLDGANARRAAVGDEAPSCSLTSLERSVLGVHRRGDVPGFEIPARYFHFLRTGQADVIRGVLDHNRYDLISLAALASHALQLAADGPGACREPGEQLGLGRLYERAGDEVRACEAYALAADGDEPAVRRQALAHYAVLMRRDARHDEAAAAWQGVLDLAAEGGFGALERRAVEALAIHHEHRARDLDSARRFADVLRSQSTGRGAALADHRLTRLGRKMRHRPLL